MSKYKAVRTGGYASKKEADYAGRFQALARAGNITEYREQVIIELVAGRGKTRGIAYVADFVYRDEDGLHYVDVKGFRTAVYILKRKLLYLLHGIEIEEL